MRGRKPTPSSLKRLRGNPGKRKQNKREAKPPAELPACPSHLDDTARAEWNRLVEPLQKLGLLSAIDTACLAAYCDCYSRWVDAVAVIRREGLTCTSESGAVYQHPAVGIANSSMKQMRAFAAEFGMTPSSRARIEVEPPAEPDEFEQLFGVPRFALN